MAKSIEIVRRFMPFAVFAFFILWISCNAENDGGAAGEGQVRFEPGYGVQSMGDTGTATTPHTPPNAASASAQRDAEWDDSGYVLFCLCMGRFGNQAEHLLGAMAFAKALNRTFVVPPFISYPPGYASIDLIPFTDLFELAPLQSYHRTITMEDFFKKFGERWPKGSREGQCYAHQPNQKACRHKEGNPFGPFWTRFGVDFDTYHPYSLPHSADAGAARAWKATFPPSKTPVIALPGAPAEFPIASANRHLQQYLVWNKKMSTKVREFIAKNLPRPFVGIHLRNGEDWVRVCDRIETSYPSLMGSPQCDRPGFAVTKEVCMPSNPTVISQVIDAVKQYGARSLFIATDDKSLQKELSAKFKEEGLKVQIAVAKDSPYFDLAILGAADYFLGNCVSTFTSFVKRERDVNGLPSGFWALQS